LEIKYELR